jgi:diaminohydroxyphosphoribosylaminopyrimidine deaminase/5-amino-6-(5-phosphoribosylamino)uracil reductase
MFSRKDEKFMELAISLAEKGSTSPNPRVGAVFVKNGKVIGKGFHKRAGAPHAEVEALRGLKKNQVKDGILYVNLEPCCHKKKRTPPCTNFLLKKGVVNIVYSHNDPNIHVNGSGASFLRNNGVKIRSGCLEKEAKKLNEVYIWNNKEKLPYIALKAAVSLDFKMALKGGVKKWLTGKKAKIYVHKFRSTYDAVLTSSRTVLIDDPLLNTRLVSGKSPLRIIIDRNLKTGPENKVYFDNNAVIATCRKEGNKLKSFRKKGIKIIIMKRGFKLRTLMKRLYKMGIMSVLIEAGPKLSSVFIKERLINKYYMFYAPLFLGKEGIGLFLQSENLKIDRIERLDSDIFIEAYPS